MKLGSRFLALPLLLLTAGACSAQNQNDYRNHGNYNEGIRQGGHGGHYYHQDDRRYDNDRRYDDRNNHQGGIGPGKGALIGAGGGALLGGLLGGGLKGSLIGGAAGAGIGAIVGKQHQNNQRRNDYYGR